MSARKSFSYHGKKFFFFFLRRFSKLRTFTSVPIPFVVPHHPLESTTVDRDPSVMGGTVLRYLFCECLGSLVTVKPSPVDCPRHLFALGDSLSLDRPTLGPLVYDVWEGGGPGGRRPGRVTGVSYPLVSRFLGLTTTVISGQRTLRLVSTQRERDVGALSRPSRCLLK